VQLTLEHDIGKGINQQEFIDLGIQGTRVKGFYRLPFKIQLYCKLSVSRKQHSPECSIKQAAYILQGPSLLSKTV
jgi:hypothetical protein